MLGMCMARACSSCGFVHAPKPPVLDATVVVTVVLVAVTVVTVVTVTELALGLLLEEPTVVTGLIVLELPTTPPVPRPPVPLGRVGSSTTTLPPQAHTVRRRIEKARCIARTVGAARAAVKKTASPWPRGTPPRLSRTPVRDGYPRHVGPCETRAR
jgi:hypothetical protein